MSVRDRVKALEEVNSKVSASPGGPLRATPGKLKIDENQVVIQPRMSLGHELSENTLADDIEMFSPQSEAEDAVSTERPGLTERLSFLRRPMPPVSSFLYD